MEERLLLDRITLHTGGVSPRDIERAAAVVADFADSGLAVGNGAAMAAREAADSVVVESFVESRFGFADSLVEDVAQGGQNRKPLISILARSERDGICKPGASAMPSRPPA